MSDGVLFQSCEHPEDGNSQHTNNPKHSWVGG